MKVNLCVGWDLAPSRIRGRESFTLGSLVASLGKWINKWPEGEDVGDVLSWRWPPQRGCPAPQRSCPDVPHLVPSPGTNLSRRGCPKLQLIGGRGSSPVAYWPVGPPFRPAWGPPPPAGPARSILLRNLEVLRARWCGTRRGKRAREGPGAEVWLLRTQAPVRPILLGS